MRPLFHCQSCGFISTLGREFVRREGVLLDVQCAADFDSGVEPVVTWVRQAIAMETGTAIDAEGGVVAKP